MSMPVGELELVNYSHAAQRWTAFDTDRGDCHRQFGWSSTTNTLTRNSCPSWPRVAGRRLPPGVTVTRW